MTGIAERVLQSSVRAQARSSVSVMMNLVEEVGELARALNRPHRCDEPAIGEIADVINCAIDLAYIIEAERRNGMGIEPPPAELIQGHLEYFVAKKCDKWDNLVEKMNHEAI